MKYTDIGHRKSKHDFVWIYADRKIWSLPANKGTHIEQWGLESKNHWLGRVEVDTGECSIVPPERLAKSYRSYPKALDDALEVEFGGDLHITAFNPRERR